MERAIAIAQPIFMGKWLYVEFFLMFFWAPLGLSQLIGSFWLWPSLWVWVLVTVFLLKKTHVFSWRKIFENLNLVDYWRLLFMAVMVFSLASFAVFVFYPERFFVLFREKFVAWFLLVSLYPLISAFPQEILFRLLYFERYRDILPKHGLMVLNATVFSFAHLVYQSWLVCILAFLGGLIFSRAYLRGEFFLCILLHSIAGIMIFTSGLGVIFCMACRV